MAIPTITLTPPPLLKVPKNPPQINPIPIAICITITVCLVIIGIVIYNRKKDKRIFLFDSFTLPDEVAEPSVSGALMQKPSQVPPRPSIDRTTTSAPDAFLAGVRYEDQPGEETHAEERARRQENLPRLRDDVPLALQPGFRAPEPSREPTREEHGFSNISTFQFDHVDDEEWQSQKELADSRRARYGSDDGHSYDSSFLSEPDDRSNHRRHSFASSDGGVLGFGEMRKDLPRSVPLGSEYQGSYVAGEFRAPSYALPGDEY